MDSSESIREKAINKFSNHLNRNNQALSNHLIENTPRILICEDDGQLICSPSIEEINDIVLSLNGTSAAGPDGYNGISTNPVRKSSNMTFLKHYQNVFLVLNFLEVGRIYCY